VPVMGACNKPERAPMSAVQGVLVQECKTGRPGWVFGWDAQDVLAAALITGLPEPAGAGRCSR
jgi:hypothetical protein